MEMQHTITDTHHHEGDKNEVRNVTIILSVLTIVELVLGYIMFKAVAEEGFLRSAIKGIIIILMLAKAFYIVAFFMHLKHELKNLIMTIIVPLFIFVWFIIAFLYEGNSYKSNRNTYDKYKVEQSNKKVEGHEGHNAEGASEKKAPVEQ